MKFYDLDKNWDLVSDLIDFDLEVRAALEKDFSVYIDEEFSLGDPYDGPSDFPSRHDYSIFADGWACDLAEHGLGFWLYTCTHACHWLVNFNLALAMKVEPDRPWRIITSDAHSTVWDGAETLFEFNSLRWGDDPEKCLESARGDGEELAVGELMATPPRPTWPERTSRGT